MHKKKQGAASASKPAIRQKKKPGNPHPVPPPEEYRFKPGQSGNPSGRPKLLGESYKQWLGTVNEQGITNAEAVALSMGLQAMKGNVGAAIEIRMATEGSRVKMETWQAEIVALLKDGRITSEEVVKEFGLEDARTILIAAGTPIPTSTPASASDGADLQPLAGAA